jgi:hypothetical protein
VHIDKLYQQKLQEHTISNDNVSIHWNQMQQQMRKALYKKRLLRWCAALSFISAGVAIALSISVSSKKNLVPTATSAIPKEPAQNNTTETVSIAKPYVQTVAVNPPTKLAAQATSSIGSNSISNTNIASSTYAKEQQEAGFYIDLSKEPQLFEIDATEGATLTCKQGTTIIIPANAIVNRNGVAKQGKVTIVVQEYYRYAGDSSAQPTAGMVKYNVYDGDEQYEINSKSQVSVKMKNDVSKIKLVNAENMVPEKQLQQMTWATNEHFFSDSRSKIDYSISLDKKYNASTFMSQLVFTNRNIVIPGNIENNALSFQKIPIGELVHFVSFGKVNNRYFSCSKKLVTGNTSLSDIDFVEVSETYYNQLLDMYTKLMENK